MYSVDKKIQLKDFAKAVAIPVGLTDSAKWPVRSGSVIFPVRNIMVHEFLSQVESSGITGKPAEWRKAFDGATQIWRNSHHLVNGLLDDNIDKNIIAKRILLLLEGVAALSNNHYFDALGSHLVMTDDETHKAFSIETRIAKPNDKKLLSLSGLLWSYSEANYFVAHELMCEYHGAYKLPGGGFMFVRDFKNLKPIELWNEREYSGIPEYIRIVTFHDSTLNIKFDVYNNLYDEHGTLAPSFTGGYAYADGQALTGNDLIGLIETISEKIVTFADEVDSMPKQDIAHKYLEIFWYRKKSLADYMGIDWRPSAELFEVQDAGIAEGQPKKVAQKKDITRTPVEQFTIDFDFSDYAV